MVNINGKEITKELFRLAFDNANTGMCLVDLDSNIFKANKLLSDIFGYSVQELEKLNVNEISHPEDKHISTRFINDSLSGLENRIVFEKKYICKNEKVIICEVTSSAVRDEQNNLLFFISNISDITEKRKIQEDLKISEKKYRLLAENISDVIWLYNLDQNKYVYISPSILNLTGFTVAEVMQQKLEENLTSKSVSVIRKTLSKSLKTFLDNPNLKIEDCEEIQQKCKDGTLIWVETVIKLQLNDNGEIEILAVSRNIDKRKESEVQLKKYAQDLKQLNADKDRFMQILAHDLRDPFTALLGFTSLLLEDLREYTTDEIEAQITLINQSAHSTFNLLNDLLLWSNSQAGKLAFQPKSLNFTAICKEIIEKQQNQAVSKKIEIKLLENDIGDLLADKDMFKLILRNLISNAIKFSPKKGLISINAEKTQNNLIITVSDNGVGISVDNQIKLWDTTKPYTTKGTEKEEGTGFGLLLCKEFVEKHGGKIWVESEVGKGSAFRFTIPNHST